MPREEVDEIYLDESYYLVPEDKVGYRGLCGDPRGHARRKGSSGLARVVLYRRERLLMLQPRGDGIVGTLLRYNNEVRDEHDYFDDIPDTKVPKDMLELADAYPARPRRRSSTRRNSRTVTRTPSKR